jgi:hypothetical protein
MTLDEINQLVEEIQQLLVSESEPATEELMDLAGRHEDVVRIIAKRLKAVDALLSKGLRSEAIELAEREPNLNDVVIALDFPELDAWNELLAEFVMQPIPSLPDDIAADLNDAYSVSAPVERLLQRHRSAALARAPMPVRIDLLRRLAVADAANPAWNQDLKLHEQYRLSVLGAELDTAIREQNLDALAALDQELTAADWKVTVPAELKRKASDAHSRLRQSSARTELNTLSYQLSDAFAAFDLDEARGLDQRFQALVQIAPLAASDQIMDIAGPALDWVRDENKKEQRELCFRESLKAIDNALNQNAPATQLEKLYYDATQYDQNLPERLESRLADRLETLKVSATRRRSTMIAAAVAGVLVMLVATGLFIWQIRIRTIIDRHVAQLNLLLPEAEKTGLTEPLSEYFRLLDEEPPAVSRAAEILGLKQQFEALRVSESARIAQIDQLIAQAATEAENAVMPKDLLEPLKAVNQAAELSKTTSEKTRIMAAETRVREKQASVQQRVDNEYSLLVKQITDSVSGLPDDNLSAYDDILRRIDDAVGAPDVSEELVATVVSLRSKVMRERSDVDLRLETARSLQQITNAVGNFQEFITQLKKSADTFPESKRSVDFQTILNSEQHLWKGALEWNAVRKELLEVNFATITPGQAKTLLDRFAAFQKASGPYPGEMTLGNRLLALQAIAKRKLGSEGTLVGLFRSAFDGKAITSAFLIEPADGKTRYYADAAPLLEKRLLFDYYTTPGGDQTISKELNLSLFPDAAKKKRDDWLSPQSRLTQSIIRSVQEAGATDFERAIADNTNRVLREEPTMDPILRLLLAERLIVSGSEGSVYIAARTEKLLNELAEAGIPRLTNWVDFEDIQTRKLRATASAFLETFSQPVLESLSGALMDRDAAGNQKIGPSVRWVGWLVRSTKEAANWEIRLKSGIPLTGGTRLCVFGRSSPTSVAAMMVVGTASADTVKPLSVQLAEASPNEGRPVFLIVDTE